MDVKRKKGWRRQYAITSKEASDARIIKRPSPTAWTGDLLTVGTLGGQGSWGGRVMWDGCSARSTQSDGVHVHVVVGFQGSNFNRTVQFAATIWHRMERTRSQEEKEQTARYYYISMQIAGNPLPPGYLNIEININSFQWMAFSLSVACWPLSAEPTGLRPDTRRHYSCHVSQAQPSKEVLEQQQLLTPRPKRSWPRSVGTTSPALCSAVNRCQLVVQVHLNCAVRRGDRRNAAVHRLQNCRTAEQYK